MLNRFLGRVHRFIAASFDGNIEAICIRHLEKSASFGNSWAQNQLGVRYLRGAGVAKDLRKAVDLFKLAAEQNQVEGCLNLAWIYSDEEYSEKSLTESIRWYRVAIENGSPIAEYNLGLLYIDGIGVEKDYRKGFSLLKSASDKGLKEAIEAIQKVSEKGYGI
ncbi:sel1 repeat family protein [Marinobacter sp. 71-i]|uniref:Sel1 repeat family protein n=1 Tax=Marinobacter iranensis TaxID=2962607 RepID=A0ABT5YGC6_9GAMM|nr:tetratricopeptide repeat protein [Marinobacter iranensis]MDF0752747.1 sel1 repeat family protein [Marinobacter iranensis]